MCTYTITEPDIKELEYRRIIIKSIENALKKGDEVFERLTKKSIDDNIHISYDRFKEFLKEGNHENLKK